MYVLSKLADRFGDALFSQRVLLLNAGGQSQRLPSASVLGKIFTALPFGDPMFQVLDLKLACYMPLLERMGPGIFHGSSDTIEVFDLGQSDSWTFERPGFTSLAHPSTLEIGTTHGVFVLDPVEHSQGQAAEFRKCLEVLQKPTVERMYSKGAVLDGKDFKFGVIDGQFAYTDSVFFFDVETAKKLLDFYKKEDPLMCEIDSYGDFLQALGPRASIEYTQDLRNVSLVEPTLVETREKIYHLLKGTDINIVALNASKFYHLGTVKEYLHHFCNDPILANEAGFQRFGVFNSLHEDESFSPQSKKTKADSHATCCGCMMHNYLPKSCHIPSSTIVEYCLFEAPVHIGSNSIISNCHYQPETPGEVCEIPDNTLLHTIPIHLPCNDAVSNGSMDYPVAHVTIVFDIKENIKKKAKDAEGALKMTFIHDQLTFAEIMASLKLSSFEELFSHNHNGKSMYTLWHAKVFPAFSSAAVSLSATLKLYKSALKSAQFSLDGVSSLAWVSMDDILKYKDVRSMIQYRANLYDKIVSAL